MSLDKAIAHGKEKRKPFRKSAAFDSSCRHGGSCPRCIGNRTVKTTRLRSRERDDQQEIEEAQRHGQDDE